MKFISHRGNLDGPRPNFENHPSYIETALQLGFEVEVDLWVEENNFLLGHDEPLYEVEFGWLVSKKNSLWVHCKNTLALVYLSNSKESLNFFWHERDTVTLTSMGYIWAFPGNQPIIGSIAVMPEINKEKIDVCKGVCTDYPHLYSQVSFPPSNSVPNY